MVFDSGEKVCVWQGQLFLGRHLEMALIKWGSIHAKRPISPVCSHEEQNLLRDSIFSLHKFFCLFYFASWRLTQVEILSFVTKSCSKQKWNFVYFPKYLPKYEFDKRYQLISVNLLFPNPWKQQIMTIISNFVKSQSFWNPYLPKIYATSSDFQLAQCNSTPQPEINANLEGSEQ